MLRAEFEEDDGITVPYGPIFDETHNNHGFRDLRGRPDLALGVAEGSQSPALQALLIDFAQPNSKFFSLGCDLGNHEDFEDDEYRYTAGGYIQIVAERYLDLSPDDYFNYCQEVADSMEEPARQYNWTLRFVHWPVDFKLENADIISSVCVWFFAGSSTPEGALRSREVLIRNLRSALVRDIGETGESPANPAATSARR